jgi:hypothetical protein
VKTSALDLLPLSGAMLSAGYSADEVSALITSIAKPVIGSRRSAKDVRSTMAWRSLLASATGVPKLAEVVGRPVVAVLKKWPGPCAVPLMTSTGGATRRGHRLTSPRIQDAVLRMSGGSRLRGYGRSGSAGKLGLIGGQPDGRVHPGRGIAAHVTRGTVWPSAVLTVTGATCWVLMNIETIRRIRSARKLKRQGDSRQIKYELHLPLKKSFDADIGILSVIRRWRAVGPVQHGAFLAGRDSHRDAEVRGLLAPFSVWPASTTSRSCLWRI